MIAVLTLFILTKTHRFTKLKPKTIVDTGMTVLGIECITYLLVVGYYLLR